MHRFLHILPILRNLVLRLPLTQRNLVIVFPEYALRCRHTFHDFSVHAAPLHVDSLAVSDITNISAKFEWTHVAKQHSPHQI